MYFHENRPLPEFPYAQQFANPFVMDWYKMQQLPYFPQQLPYYQQALPYYTQQYPYFQKELPYFQQQLPYFQQQLPQPFPPWQIQKPILPF